jgi:hypothetical protein
LKLTMSVVSVGLTADTISLGYVLGDWQYES